MKHDLLSDSLVEKAAAFALGSLVAGGALTLPADAVPVVTAATAFGSVLGAIGLRAAFKRQPEYETAWKAAASKISRQYALSDDADEDAVREASIRLEAALDHDQLFTLASLKIALASNSDVVQAMTSRALEAISLRDPGFREIGLARDFAEKLLRNAFTAAIESSCELSSRISLLVGEATLHDTRDILEATSRTAEEMALLRASVEKILSSGAANSARSAGLNEAQVRNLLTAFAFQGVSLDQAEPLLLKAAEELKELRARLIRLSNQDPETQDLKLRAASAIDEGLLSDARRLVLQAAARHRRAGEELESALHLHRISEAEAISEAAKIDHLQARYIDAATLYEEAALVSLPFDAEISWKYRNLQAESLFEHGRLTTSSSLIKAIDIWQQHCLSHTSKQERPYDWAFTQNKIGGALALLGERTPGGQGIVWLRDTVETFYNALEVYTEIEASVHWASTQNNIGMSLGLLGKRTSGSESARYLTQAVDACRASSQTPKELCGVDHWAGFQSNLGLALHTLAERYGGKEAEDLLLEAVDAYHAALDALPEDETGPAWIKVQTNLAMTLYTLGLRTPPPEGIFLLAESVDVYRQTLLAIDIEKSPADWGSTQSNFGLTLVDFARKLPLEEAKPLVNEAISCLKDAARTLENIGIQIQWGMAQNNLGIAFSAAEMITSDTTEKERFLKESHEAHRLSLTVYSIEHSPAAWAQANLNLLAIEAKLAERQQNISDLRMTIDRMESVLEVFRAMHAEAWVETAERNVNIMRKMLQDLGRS